MRRVVIATVDAPVAVGPESWPEPVQAPGEALGADPAAGRATELTRGVRPLVTGENVSRPMMFVSIQHRPPSDAPDM